MLLSYSVRLGSSLERKILNETKPINKNAAEAYILSRREWKRKAEENDIKNAPRTMLKRRGGRLVKSEHQPFYK